MWGYLGYAPVACWDSLRHNWKNNLCVSCSKNHKQTLGKSFENSIFVLYFGGFMDMTSSLYTTELTGKKRCKPKQLQWQSQQELKLWGTNDCIKSFQWQSCHIQCNNRSQDHKSHRVFGKERWNENELDASNINKILTQLKIGKGQDYKVPICSRKTINGVCWSRPPKMAIQHLHLLREIRRLGELCQPQTS